MKITDSVKRKNIWRINNFRNYKHRPYNLDTYEQDIRNLELSDKVYYTDNDKIFRNEIKKMVKNRIQAYENLS